MNVILALAVFASPPAPAGGVYLEDALAFGVEKNTCRWMFNLARDQEGRFDFQVMHNNPPEVTAAWYADVRYRRKAWDLLDDVLYCSWDDAKKLDSLRRLRDLIGEADYYAGRIPPPLANHKVPGPWGSR